MKTLNNTVIICEIAIFAIVAIAFMSLVIIVTSNGYAIALAWILSIALGWVLYVLWKRTNSIAILVADNKVTKRNIQCLEEVITGLETKMQILRNKITNKKEGNHEFE